MEGILQAPLGYEVLREALQRKGWRGLGGGDGLILFHGDYVWDVSPVWNGEMAGDPDEYWIGWTRKTGYGRTESWNCVAKTAQEALSVLGECGILKYDRSVNQINNQINN